MNLGSDQIQALALQINDAISGVSNVDQILDDTNESLSRAKMLKESVESIRDEAVKQLRKAENVTLDLSKALEAQNEADQKIQTTQTDIDSARNDLAMISYNMEAATAAADISVDEVKDLSERQEAL